MSSVQTTNLIKANKDFIVGYFQSKYKSNAWSFMNNKTDPLKRATHGAAHIKVTPKDAESKKLMGEGFKVDHYYYVTSSIINWGNKGFRLSLRQDLIDCISVSEVPEENYHFLVLSGDLYADVTFKDLKSLRKAGEVLSNQFKQTCLLYSLKNEMYHPKSMIAKPKYTNIKYDESNTWAYYEPSFKPECIGNVRYCKKHFKGLFCIDIYDGDGDLKVEKYIVGVNMRDLFNGLKAKSDTGNFDIDCSNDLAFRKKVRAGRDVKLTNKDTEVVLYARIRELEKRVKFLEEENKQLKVRVEKVEKDVVELKDTKADKSEVVKKEDLVAFKNWVVGYCAKGKNKLTKDAIESNGYKELFAYLLLAGILTSSKDYYSIHWDLLKDCITKVVDGEVK